MLTGTPPSLLAVQAAGPLGQPWTAVSRSPSSTGFRAAAMTTGHPRDSTSYGGGKGALSAHARRQDVPAPTRIMPADWLKGGFRGLTDWCMNPRLAIPETADFTSDILR